MARAQSSLQYPVCGKYSAHEMKRTQSFDTQLHVSASQSSHVRPYASEGVETIIFFRQNTTVYDFYCFTVHVTIITVCSNSCIYAL
jgi:hypothetical protein